MTVGIGLRGQKGGAMLVGLTIDDERPQLLLSTFLLTHDEGDRLSLEPYGVASDMARSPQGKASAEAAAAVAEGRGRQNRLAARRLKAVVDQLEETGRGPILAGLIVNRAGWITDLLQYGLAWPDHVPVAEGLAVREALRHGLQQCGVPWIELDEKSLPQFGEESLSLTAAQIDAHLKALGVAAGKPWRKEQKAACLSAWIAAAKTTLASGDEPVRP